MCRRDETALAVLEESWRLQTRRIEDLKWRGGQKWLRWSRGDRKRNMSRKIEWGEDETSTTSSVLHKAEGLGLTLALF